MHFSADLLDREDVVSRTVTPGKWHHNPSGGIAGLHGATFRPAKDAVVVQQNLTRYFNSDGKFPWQREMALLH